MARSNPRLSGLRKLSIEARRVLVADFTGIPIEEVTAALSAGGLTPETADKFVENVLGTYSLPFGVAANVVVNGKSHAVPMVVEEPSVIAAASGAAKLIASCGGFEADGDPPIMTGQIQLYEVEDVEAAGVDILREKEALLAIANRAAAGLVERGGGAKDLEVRVIAPGMVVVHVYVDCRDAMGANLVNCIAESVGDRIAALGRGKRGLRILSNQCDRRRVRVRARIREDLLATDTLKGSQVIAGIVNASRFAEADPYRAATHNKGIMNGIDGVCMATGNDWRAVEAGAHAFAARTGKYQPLSIWRGVKGEDGEALLEGSIELPLALGIVGGTLRVHPTARLALKLLGVASATELAMVAAAVGLASNLAALRALATDGIQRGHMALHARSVAIAAGATPAEVDRIALLIVEARNITVEGATRALETLRVDKKG